MWRKPQILHQSGEGVVTTVCGLPKWRNLKTKDELCRKVYLKQKSLMIALTPILHKTAVMCSNFCAVGSVRDFQVLLCDRKEIVGFVEHLNKGTKGWIVWYKGQEGTYNE